MSYTTARGIVVLDGDDRPTSASFTDTADSIDAAIDDAVASLPGGVLAAPIYMEDNNTHALTAGTGSGDSTGNILHAPFTLATAGIVMVYAQTHVEPPATGPGNAAGQLQVLLDGVVTKVRSWHTRGSNYHQWPALWAAIPVPSGHHTLDVVGTISNGSVGGVNYDHTLLSAQ